ncbi:MAG: hypothetical protein R6U68_12035 [Desulfobacteraceae bacterium]
MPDTLKISIYRKNRLFLLPVPLKNGSKKKGLSQENQKDLLDFLPPPLLSALADSSDDPEELVRIAEKTCTFVFDQENKRPAGLVFKTDSSGIPVPDIKNHALFDTVANNIHLPDDYKAAMVLTPGIQGTSPITGDWEKKDEKGKKPKSHVFEYLRQNSYIPWGHFAANTADDTVRYRVKDLVFDDIKGMRRLFYQRIYTSVAVQLGIELPASREKLSRDQLEEIRKKSLEKIRDSEKLKFNGSLWGWNFGFGFAHCGYRLHASHQQIHQQYAMIPETVSDTGQGSMPSFACGDMVAEFIEAYRQIWGKNFFETYMSAIRSNERVDRDPKKSSRLVVFEDENIMVFVPKAQTSQWELQLMPLKPCGNILEADEGMRCSLDRGILTALKILEAMGAKMITSIEYSKRFDSKDSDQRVVYAFLPKIPFSPGAFSEAQLRWINGHYPEDFALACRSRLKAFE